MSFATLDGLAAAQGTGQRMVEAELYRLRGELPPEDEDTAGGGGGLVAAGRDEPESALAPAGEAAEGARWALTSERRLSSRIDVR